MARTVGLIIDENIVEEFNENKELLACEVCGKEFKTQKGLDNHMEKEHINQDTD